MKTMAVAAAEAAVAAELVESVVDVLRVVPSAEAWVLIASRGATRY
jgi:hypothetical protein